MVTQMLGIRHMDATDGSAYMKKRIFEQNKYKNGSKMSVLYMSCMFFSMYASAQMPYNERADMDKSVIPAEVRAWNADDRSGNTG